MKMRTLLLPATLAFGIAGAAAQTVALPESQPRPYVSGTEVRQAGGIRYLNGGVGESERAAMSLRAGQFPLQIVLSGQNGQYVVADQLTVSNAHGEVLHLTGAGPVVMIDLPLGHYKLQASVEGIKRERTVSVAEGGPKVQWNIPAVGQ